MKRFVPLAVLLLAAPAFAKTVAGVNLPDTASVAGKTLRLNGAGVRSKFIFKVYVAGLYLEKPTRNADEAVASEQAKRVELHLLRDLDRAQITDAIEEGFQKNSGSRMTALKPRLERLGGMIPSVRSGEVIQLTYLPGKGTVVTARGAEKGTIEGKDFADALFSVWLGRTPVQGDLKNAMLGG